MIAETGGRDNAESTMTRLQAVARMAVADTT